MPVDPVEQDAVAVDGQHAVDDRHRAEADPQPDLTALGAQHRVVQPRHLGAPGLDPLDRHPLAGRDLQPQLRDGDDPGDVRLDQQRATPGQVVVVRVHEDIGRSRRSQREQVHLAEDSGQPPHVLVLEVAAGRPLVHPHGDPDLMARGNKVGQVELGRQPAARRPADQLSVDPDREPRVHPLEPQHDPRAVPVGGDRHGPDVVAGRVRRRHVRRLQRERVDHVRVRRPAVALELPMPGHRDGVPAGGVRDDDVVRGVGQGRGEPEPPVTGEREAGGIVVQPGPGRQHLRTGEEAFDVRVVCGHRHRPYRRAPVRTTHRPTFVNIGTLFAA